MDVLDSTHRHYSRISKVFFVGVHNDCGRYDFLDSARRCEVALKRFGDSLRCVLLYFFNHQSEEFVPLSLKQFNIILNFEFLLTFVGNEGTPEFLSIVVDVFWEVKHNGNPHIVGGKFDVSVVAVCMVDSWEKSIAKDSRHRWWFTDLFISQEFCLTFP